MPSAKSPDAYRTISEAAAETGLPAHVLRFWESKFSQLKPVKRKGGRRMYRPSDLALIRGLKRLLYEKGLTIKGAQKYLREHGVGAVAAIADIPDAAPVQETADPGAPRRTVRRKAREDVSEVAERLQAAKSKLDEAIETAARDRG